MDFVDFGVPMKILALKFLSHCTVLINAVPPKN